MAQLLYLGVRRITAQHDGDASRIRAGGIGSASLVRRFPDFDGLGPKIFFGKFGILNVQNMDFHGSYRRAASNLRSVLHPQRGASPRDLAANQRGLSDGT